MNLDEIKIIYFLGIGGIGMSALARYFLNQGVRIYGYDRTATTLTAELISEGMNIHYEENCKLIPADIDMVVYTPAIPKENTEFQYLSDLGIPMKKRAQVLGEITKNGETIAIAGSHGKTTTSTMVSHILREAGTDLTGFLGGISKNYETNFITQPGGQINRGSAIPGYFVVEADEFDRSFLQLNPYIGIITSVDADHLDIYGSLTSMKESYAGFANNIVTGGTLILKKGLDFSPVFSSGKKIVYYSASEQADYYPQNIVLSGGNYTFDLKTPEVTIENISFGQPGLFNLENAIAAAAVAITLRVPDETVKRSLSSFKGVRRRFDIRVRNKDLIYIDDYAHHPEEIKACIQAVRETWPGKKITGIFQPHLYSRTRDFAGEFAKSLGLLDEVILLDIYAAREKPIEGISSEFLLGKIHTENKILLPKEEVLMKLSKMKPEILLTMGAGDIDKLVSPISEIFNPGGV
jgi:UDP-N-acetylmuramate--alanine ligase